MSDFRREWTPGGENECARNNKVRGRTEERRVEERREEERKGVMFPSHMAPVAPSCLDCNGAECFSGKVAPLRLMSVTLLHQVFETDVTVLPSGLGFETKTVSPQVRSTLSTDVVAVVDFHNSNSCKTGLKACPWCSSSFRVLKKHPHPLLPMPRTVFLFLVVL